MVLGVGSQEDRTVPLDGRLFALREAQRLGVEVLGLGTWSQEGNAIFIQISKVNVQVTMSGKSMQGTVDVAYNDFNGSHHTVTKVFLQKMANNDSSLKTR